VRLLLLARLAPALLAPAACAGTASHVGSGPITLSPGVRAYYEQYRGLTSPSAFAVSADGRAAGYSYCAVGIDCRGNDVNDALNACRRSSRGRPCYIYDLGGTVVWCDAAPAATR
jgi:hypothetical protein